MEKAAALKVLQDEYLNCPRCPELVVNRTNVVFGVGNPDKCKIVIIGEAPGNWEDKKNEPFVGKSGQILNQLLESVGLKREEVYITNTILCRPPDNRNPTAQELRNCRNRLDTHIKILAPKVIITLGNFATKYMLETKKGITDLHGQVVEKNSMKIIPMFHPAVLLYSGMSPEKRKIMEDDFKKVKEILASNPKLTNS
ncbi:MAG: uracil-DNA glycosylase [Candidatus Woesearchaeota archaeon]